MPDNNEIRKSEIVGMDNLQTEFLSLKVGETIPRLEIHEIRKVINTSSPNNLSGVDYKYIIESKDKRILTVNSWILWKQIAQALKKAGRIQSTLELKHLDVEDYSVRVIE